ncbi:AAA family ATPase [Aquamicrobium zhengzhouense]|uniref:AAA family ATPase n=1 Tax=Aquamicrobium zhengzhouense TaxID=2781738 RepID=A0ABS0SGZ5_9HYPH|nr:AAA family ATPase [Aquamicrobium zhengzhouense]MBI1622573.1 AAA family ATPase [Aquamicrobium zhengzhouense]
MTTAQLNPTPDPVRQHVEMLHRLADGVDGLLVASAFNANLHSDKGTITHHHVGDVDGMVAAIDAHRDTPGANVYCGLQVMRRSLARGQRGGEKDIVAVLGLVADLDADTGKAAGEYPLAPNYVIETSPGNLQPFWLFDTPLTPDVAKEIARGLKMATGSDHGTADIAHVWRVPGTLNWPNAKKLARGRSPEPVPVTVTAPWDGTVTSAADLHRAVGAYAVSAAEPVMLGDLPEVDGVEVSTEAAALLGANGVDDRSAHAARVVEKLAFDGHPAEVAAALFLSATGDWLERYPTEERATADFQRLWGRFGAPHVESRANAEAFAARVVARVSGTAPAPANDNRNEKKDGPTFPGILTSAEFVRGFTPPDYLIDGIIQSGFLYSITGQTGSGKTAVALLVASCLALGEPLADQEVKQGRILYFAGENPDDVRMRWIGLCHELAIDPADIDAHFVEGVFSISEFAERIERDVAALGGCAAIFVDTTAAYFPGMDENSNVEMGHYARLLRSLTRIPCRPAVIAASHPVKNAAADNLLPRGGGAFLNEVDGNLSLAKKGDRTSELHWQGKFRGPDFKPITFDLPEIKVPTLVDSRGREIPTVRAVVVEESEIAARAQASSREDSDVLLAVRNNGNRSLRELAECLGWNNTNGEPDKRKVQRVTERLKRSGHVVYELSAWKLTKKGDAAATEAATQRHKAESSKRMVEGLVAKSRSRRTNRNRKGTEAA